MTLTKHLPPLFQNIHRSVFHCLSSATASLPEVRQAHAQIYKSGCFNDSFLSTKLISHYANHQCFSDANEILTTILQPDVFSFSTLIYAYSKRNLFKQSLSVFSRMLSQGLAPDSHVLPNIVKACSGLLSLKTGKQVHGIICACGFDSDSFVQSALIHMYVKCDKIPESRKLFDRLPQPDVVVFSALLAGYARQGRVYEAKKLFGDMESSDVEPNLVSWNGMIAGFNHSGNHEEAVDIFWKMHLQGFKPDEVSISSALSAVGDIEYLELGIQIHGYAIREGLISDKCVCSSLIDMYGKCGYTWDMLRAFDEIERNDIGACNALVTGFCRNGLIDKAMELFKLFRSQGMELNIVSWTSIIAGCSQNGKDIEALELFKEMQEVGLKPNKITIPCLLPACGNIAALMHGKAAHCFSIRTGICDDIYVSSALIDMYAKCGRIQTSRLCFNKLPSKNLVCWNALIGGYAMHGKAKEAIEIFHLMLRSGQKPDLISFTCVLSACSQVGLTDEGCNYFDNMLKEYGIEPRLEHYACMVNLLGRAGRLHEAYNMIEQMPYDPDACVWGALLSSCRVHNDVIFGEAAAKKLFELEPTNSGNYVLLSNIYASNGMWKEVDAVRDLMKTMDLRKYPGCSWIDVKSKVHMLLAGDKSHPQMTQIMEKLGKLNMEMKKSGYSPHIDLVLHDVEEQEKEHILCGHSEKLAVAFGLLKTPPGSPLQVIKNLRICGDCHEVIKFISKFEGRDIFVRDTNRFHHFKDGVCSCGDYW